VRCPFFASSLYAYSYAVVVRKTQFSECPCSYGERPPFVSREGKAPWIEQHALDERIVALEQAKVTDDQRAADLERRMSELEARISS
jgi:hypothetical protein